MKLHISKDLAIPLDLATQTVAIVARKRVGKTYTASVMAEELIKAKVPIVVLDPTGAWWGLRSSADGKHEGFPVVIIGGEHADVPLEETAGKVIADLVVDRPGYYVIDFSKFEHDAQIHRFATEFGKRFYFRKEQERFPIQLIIDEADVVAPQKPQPNQTVMLHTYDNIVRRGGIRGIGVTMITQRPAVLNKNILTQCETLIILQMSGSQDIDAIEHWMRIHGSEEERKRLLTSVPTLQRGEAWVWSPSWLQICRRVQIRERETFNSSATPKAGEIQVAPKKLAPVDIEALGEQIKATVQKQKENDPAELKKEIDKLRRSLASATIQKVETKEVRVITDDDLMAIKNLADAFEPLRAISVGVSEQVNEMAGKIIKLYLMLENTKNGQNVSHIAPPKPLQRAPVEERQPNHVYSEESKQLGKCEREILKVLGAYRLATKNKVAIIAGYSPNSGSFRNALSKLRSLGLIHSGEPISITQSGLAVAPSDMPPTGQELFDSWMRHPALGLSERRIMQVLKGGWEMTKEAVAEQSGYAVTSGSFRNSLSKLRTLELINRGDPIRLAEEFAP